MWKILFILLFALATSVAAQTKVYTIAGLTYLFPSSHAVGVLINNGTGTLSWSTGMPTGMIMWSKLGSCPSGFTEFTGGRGRAVVDFNTGFTLGGSIGTALSNGEDRAVGQHNHTATPSISLSNPTHVHGVTDPGHVHGGRPDRASNVSDSPGGSSSAAGSNTNTTTDPTGVTLNSSATGAGVTGSASTTIDNAGSVVGTNAPYVQLMMCQKS